MKAYFSKKNNTLRLRFDKGEIQDIEDAIEAGESIQSITDSKLDYVLKDLPEDFGFRVVFGLKPAEGKEGVEKFVTDLPPLKKKYSKQFIKDYIAETIEREMEAYESDDPEVMATSLFRSGDPYDPEIFEVSAVFFEPQEQREI